MRKMQKAGLLFGVGMALGSTLASVSRGAYTYDVTLDTSAVTPAGTLPLSTNDAAPFYVYFQLSGNNGDSASISNFSGAATVPGSGSAVFGDTGNNTTGGTGTSSGDLTSTISLTDDTTNVSPYSGFYQPIAAGTSMTFKVSLSGPLVSSNPDALDFAILDSGGNPIPTMDPSTANNLVIWTLDTGGPHFISYPNDPTTAPTASPTGTPISYIPAASVVETSIPEPSSLCLLGFSMPALLKRCRRA